MGRRLVVPGFQLAQFEPLGLNRAVQLWRRASQDKTQTSVATTIAAEVFFVRSLLAQARMPKLFPSQPEKPASFLQSISITTASGR